MAGVKTGFVVFETPGGAPTALIVTTSTTISLLGDRQTVAEREWVRIAIEDGSDPKPTGWIPAQIVVDASPVPGLEEDINRAVFVENCLIASYNTGSNVHFLAAWAEFETNIRNVAKAIGPETRIGPFQFTQKAWDENRTSKQHGMDFLATDITEPAFQCEVAALSARRAVDAYMEAAGNVSPTVVQLILALRIGVPATIGIVKAGQDIPVSNAIRQGLAGDPGAAAKATAIMEQDADLLAVGVGQSATAANVLASLHQRLDAALNSTRQLVLNIDEALLPKSDETIEGAGDEGDGEEPDTPDTSDAGAGGKKSKPAETKIPFAVHDGPVKGLVWPVITTSKSALVVSHKTTTGKLVGHNGRRFLADRQGGKRFHVGVDIFCSNGEEVVACAPGKIVAFHRFYKTKAGELSYALLIDHGGFVINYGEVKPDSNTRYNWKIGDQVSAGQKIARVSTTDMIHFETYVAGTTATAKWMQDGSPPPSALLDPTKFLIDLSVANKQATLAGSATNGSSEADTDAAGADKVAWGLKADSIHGPAFKQKVLAISAELPVDPSFLMAVMAFETSRTFSPSIKNFAGSGATGLIQFMPDTAMSLGTSTATLAAMTAVDQLDFVRKYFAQWTATKTLSTLSDVYMAVLFPAAIGKAESHVLFTAGTTAYNQNRGLDINNDGKITKAEASHNVHLLLTEGMRAENLG